MPSKNSSRKHEGLCPECGGTDQVVDSRFVIREGVRQRYRRRECEWCATRFTTYESVTR